MRREASQSTYHYSEFHYVLSTISTMNNVSPMGQAIYGAGGCNWGPLDSKASSTITKIPAKRDGFRYHTLSFCIAPAPPAPLQGPAVFTSVDVGGPSQGHAKFAPSAQVSLL